jgi:uncharacterized membrane protein
MQSVYQVLFLFLIYAFLGWCVEVSFVAVTSGRVVNRGFLNGPVCPIYGVGMVGVLLLLEPVQDNLLLLFLGGMLLCTLVELIGGWVLEKVFHTRWWDYSNQPFNLGGYVCLGFSIMWGLAVTFVVRLVHPVIFSLVCAIPTLVGWILLGIFYALFLADFIVTLVTIIGIRKQLGELQRVAEALHNVSDSLSDRVGNSALAADAKLTEAKEVGQEKMAESREKLAEAKEQNREKLAEAKELRREKLAEAREQSREMLTEAREQSREMLTEAREQSREKLTEAKEGLAEARELSREKLEQRRKELVQLLGEAPRFGTRRLSGAFPALKKGLRERLEDYKK